MNNNGVNIDRGSGPKNWEFDQQGPRWSSHETRGNALGARDAGFWSENAGRYTSRVEGRGHNERYHRDYSKGSHSSQHFKNCESRFGSSTVSERNFHQMMRREEDMWVDQHYSMEGQLDRGYEMGTKFDNVCGNFAHPASSTTSNMMTKSGGHRGERERNTRYQGHYSNDSKHSYHYKEYGNKTNDSNSKRKDSSSQNSTDSGLRNYRKQEQAQCQPSQPPLIIDEEFYTVYERELDSMIRKNYGLKGMLEANSRLRDILAPLIAKNDAKICKQVLEPEQEPFIDTKLPMMISITEQKIKQVSSCLMKEIDVKGQAALLSALSMPTCNEKFQNYSVESLMELLKASDITNLNNNKDHCSKVAKESVKERDKEKKSRESKPLKPGLTEKKKLPGPEISKNQKRKKLAELAKKKHDWDYMKGLHLETPEEKLCAFINEVKKEEPKTNKIMLIENLLCKFGKSLMNPVYTLDFISGLSGRGDHYSASFYLDGLFITRCSGFLKKELKHTVFTSVYKLLKTGPIDEILKREDPGPYAEDQESIQVPEPCVDDDNGNKLLSIVTQLKAFFSEKVFSESISVSVLKQACMKTGYPISLEYDVHERFIIHGRPYYKGTLKIENIILSIGWAFKKKETRQETYFNAISRLQTLSPEEIAEGMEDSHIPEPGSNCFTVQSAIPPLEERFKSLIKFVQENYNVPPKNSIVCSIDTKAIEVFLSPTVVYQKVGSSNTQIKCLLFLSDTYISSAEETSKRESQMAAYHASWQALMFMELDKLLNQREPLQNEDINGVNIIEVVMKGNQKMLMNKESTESDSSNQ